MRSIEEVCCQKSFNLLAQIEIAASFVNKSQSEQEAATHAIIHIVLEITKRGKLFALQYWMGQNLLNYYGYLNKGMYDHFILNRYENDFSSVKSEDSEEANTSDMKLANIKPRKTKFPPQSFYNCAFCGKWYRSKTSLGLHRRLECGKEPAFQCPYCPLKTHQKGNLQVHIKKKHTYENRDDSQSLKSRNPILAQELGMVSNVNAQQLGITQEISSELTITRTQACSSYFTNSTKTPNLSHILSQPNKARGITQFPLTVTEINATSRHQNDQNKIRVKGLVNIPSGIVITQKKVPQDTRTTHINTNVPTEESFKRQPIELPKTDDPLDISSVNSIEGTSKQSDIRKLPELTRILNSQEPIPPIPMIVDVFSTRSSSPGTTIKNETLAESSIEAESADPPDSTDKETALE